MSCQSDARRVNSTQRINTPMVVKHTKLKLYNSFFLVAFLVPGSYSSRRFPFMNLHFLLSRFFQPRLVQGSLRFLPHPIIKLRHGQSPHCFCQNDIHLVQSLISWDTKNSGIFGLFIIGLQFWRSGRLLECCVLSSTRMKPLVQGQHCRRTRCRLHNLVSHAMRLLCYLFMVWKELHGGDAKFLTKRQTGL